MATTKKKKKKKAAPKKKKAPFKRAMGSTKTQAKREKVTAYDNLRKQLSQESRGGDYFKCPPGSCTIRLVPFTHEGQEHIFVPDPRHWNTDAAGGTGSVVCLERDGGDCPICDAKDLFSEKTWSKIKCKIQWLVNVIVRALDDSAALEEDEVKIAQINATVFGTEYTESRGTNGLSYYLVGEGSDKLGDPLSPKKGRDFKIKRTGQKLLTRYTVAPKKNSSAWGMDVTPVDLISRLMKPADLDTYKDIVEKLS